MTLSRASQEIVATRGAQMFPTLTPSEIDRLRRFGTCRSYPAGAILAKAGERGEGVIVFLTGEAEITQNEGTGARLHIVRHGPGSFAGELAQLSGRPSLVDCHALTDIDAVSYTHLTLPTKRIV